MYTACERGVWSPEYSRITDPELAAAVAAGTVTVAIVDGAVAGVCTFSVEGGHGVIGLLVVVPEHRGRGIGGALMTGAEARAAALPAGTVTHTRFDLLLPADPGGSAALAEVQAGKSRLAATYIRRGYSLEATADNDTIERKHPSLVPFLIAEVVVDQYVRPLVPAPS